MHIQGVNIFRFRTTEQRVKVVDFDVCQNTPKLIGCHSNDPWATAKLVSFVISIHVTATEPSQPLELACGLVRRGRITNYHLIAYSFSNTAAKNYQNWLICIEVIVCNASVVFLRQCN